MPVERVEVDCLAVDLEVLPEVFAEVFEEMLVLVTVFVMVVVRRVLRDVVTVFVVFLVMVVVRRGGQHVEVLKTPVLVTAVFLGHAAQRRVTARSNNWPGFSSISDTSSRFNNFFVVVAFAVVALAVLILVLDPSFVVVVRLLELAPNATVTVRVTLTSPRVVVDVMDFGWVRVNTGSQQPFLLVFIHTRTSRRCLGALFSSNPLGERWGRHGLPRD